MKCDSGVSLCMIVKNESENMKICFDSVRHLVDEMIIVDTGSDDNTIQIATDLGAKVYRYEWDENFASARNFGLMQATKEWILVLDADERMENVAKEAFVKLLSDSTVQGYYVTIRSLIDKGCEYVEDQVVRLFRNKEMYRFHGAIHEQVAGSIKAVNNGGGLSFAGLTIFHTGYTKVNLAERKKFQRNIKVISRALGESPGDPFLLYSLGMEYIQAGDHAAGQECLENSLASMQGNEGYFHHVICSLLLSFYHTGNHEKLKELLERSQNAFPDDPDIKAISGLQALATGDYEQGIELLSTGLTEANTLVPVFHRTVLIGDAYFKIKRYQEAEAYFHDACRLAPEFVYSLRQLLTIRRSGAGVLTWQEVALYTHPRNLLSIHTQLMAVGDWGTALPTLIMAMLGAVSRREGELLKAARDMLRDDIAKLDTVSHDNLFLRYLKTLLEQVDLYSQCQSCMMLHDCLWPERSFSNLLVDALEFVNGISGE